MRAIALALVDGIGWTLINRLLERFGSLENILAAPPADLQTVRGIGKHLSAQIAHIDLEKTARSLAEFAANGISCATWRDVDYPGSLHMLDDRPLVLFWRGALPPLDARAIAIVGTREPTDESARLASEWAGAFARQGWIVISGMARGVDTYAHQGALRAGGRTLAVLGCGVNRVYPPENRALAHRIAGQGALLSEFHPDSGIGRDTLVFRNRLISALSRATMVIEAGETSGALHAARHAHAQGRSVFARPGSAGNDALLRDSAYPLPGDPDQIDEVIARCSPP